MASEQPKYLDSPFYVSRPGGGYFKPGAPQDLIDEFNEFMQNDEAEDFYAPKLTKEDLKDL